VVFVLVKGWRGELVDPRGGSIWSWTKMSSCALVISVRWWKVPGDW
jgi:hypothetical protein